MTSPRSRCEPGCAVVSVSIAVIRPSVTVNRTPSASTESPPSQACSHHHVSVTVPPSPPSRRPTPPLPVLQSLDSANSVGECDTPVGLRTNNIAVGTTGGQDACVVAGLGGQHRDVAEVGQRTLQPCPRTRGKLDDRRDRFGAVTPSSMPSAAACCRASAVILSTSDRSVASSAARASSQACTDDGIALAPLGATMTLPNVATASWAAASDRAACTEDANASIGSRRSASRVVPAWFASPQNVNCQRPCGQMAEATAIGRSTRSSARPCSTCSST